MIRQTAKEWLKEYGDDAARVGEGLNDQLMTKAEFEAALKSEMKDVPRNIYRDGKIFSDLKKIRKELIDAPQEEKDALLEKAIEAKEPRRQKASKRVLKPQKKVVDKPDETE